MPCYSCGRVQTDPARGASPWARGVLDGHQVLVCPDCQSQTDWSERFARCPKCSGSRLSLILGSIVCRGCGYETPQEVTSAEGPSNDFNSA